jgi:hypothetical protein
MRCPTKGSSGRLSVPVAVLALATAFGCRNPVSPYQGKLYLTLTQTQAAQGDTVALTITLPEGPVVGDQLIVTFSGYGRSVDSITIPAGVVAYGADLAIPAEIADGVLAIQASIPEIHQTAADSVVIKDNVPPQITGMRLVPPRPLPPYAMALAANPPYGGGVSFIAGLADTLHAIVSDNHALGWLFLAWGKPINQLDSIRLTGVADTLAIPIELPSSAAGTAPQLTITLSDVDGNKMPTAYGAAQVAQYADYPARTAPLTTSVSDLAFDSKRNLVYLAEPTAKQIAVLSPATMTFLTPIAVTGRPIGVDVRPGGDSIVTTLDSSSTIAIIDLTNVQHTTTTLVMPELSDTNVATDTVKQVAQVRVAADNRAIVSMYGPSLYSDLFSDAGVAVNLTNDSISVLFGPSIDGVGLPPVLRSPDGTWVMLTNGAPGPYISATHTYSGWSVGSDGTPEITSISNGPDYRYLVDHVFFSTANFVEGSVGLDRFFGAALSPGGADAYVADAPCAAADTACVTSASGVVLHYAVPIMLNGPDTGLIGSQQQGQLMTISDAPFVARSVAVTPDGKTLIGIGTTGIFALDLTQTTPPSLARMTRARSGARISTPSVAVRSTPPRPGTFPFQVQLAPHPTRQWAPLERHHRTS